MTSGCAGEVPALSIAVAETGLADLDGDELTALLSPELIGEATGDGAVVNSEGDLSCLEELTILQKIDFL